MTKKPTIADDLIAGFTELADALETKRDIGGQFNCYQVRLDLPPAEYTPALVKRTRFALRSSQAIFAKFLGVSAKTVQQWEQGAMKPKAIARRFMDEIRRNPEYYVKRLKESLVAKTRR